MREQVERDEREHHSEPVDVDDDGDTEVEAESSLGRKVAG